MLLIKKYNIIRCLLTLCFIALPTYLSLAVDLPPITADTFIQTTGPNAGLNIGDFYTNVNGANQDHLIEIYVSCAYPDTLPITFALYDPESSEPDPSGLDANDEIRNSSDDTTFTLSAPDGNVVGPITFSPAGGTNGLWVELTTLTHGTVGNGCGTYTLTTSTSDNDDNAWRLRVANDPDCTTSAGTCTGIGSAQSTLLDNGNEDDDPDGNPGSGDEIEIGLTRTSFQHNAGGTVCQDFFLYIDGQTSPISLNNFDIDNNGSITYFPPISSAYSPSQIGTVSGNQVWNSPLGGGTPPPRGGDSFAITSNDIGWWQTQVCVSNNNQYIFEGLDGEPIFFEQPPFPTMNISKDDGLTTVSSNGEEVTYIINYENTGTGAAIDTIISDTLPTGANFVGCTGGCVNGTPIIWDLGIVPASPSANSSGSVTLTVQLPSAPISSTHTNTVSVDYTDFVGNIYPDPTDTDVDVVIFSPTPESEDNDPTPTIEPISETPSITTVDSTITKSVDNPFALPGELITWIITVHNSGNVSLFDISVNDTLPQEVILLDVSSSAGSTSIQGQSISLSIDELAPDEQITLQIRTQIRNDVNLPYIITNTACLEVGSISQQCADATVLSITVLPKTGQSPYSPWRSILFCLTCIISVGFILFHVGKHYRGVPPRH